MNVDRFRQRFRTVVTHRRPARLLLSRFLWRSGLCRYFRISRPDFELRFFPSSLSATYWVDPEDRHEDEHLIRLILRPGEVYVDAGANIGALALCASHAVGATGAVYAIEAHPRTYDYLQGNVALNGRTNIQCFNAALGSADGGEISITDNSDDDQNRIAAGGVAVSARTLDGLLGGQSQPLALLKIDVEGYELPVLQGAAQTLQRSRAVLFEVWERHLERYGFATTAILDLLRSAGFSLYSVRLGAQQLVPVPRDFRAARCENLLALRDPAAFCRATGFVMSDEACR